TTQDTEKFATYHRDATNLDYADQRYYTSAWGRFLTPDPAEPGDPSNPASWNLYAYVQGDPVNFNDPAGLDVQKLNLIPGPETCYSKSFSKEISGDVNRWLNSDAGTLALQVWFEFSSSVNNQFAQHMWLSLGNVYRNRWLLSPDEKRFQGFDPKADFKHIIYASAGHGWWNPKTDAGKQSHWNANGTLKSSRVNELVRILNSAPNSRDCDALIASFQTSIDVHEGETEDPTGGATFYVHTWYPSAPPGFPTVTNLANPFGFRVNPFITYITPFTPWVTSGGTTYYLSAWFYKPADSWFYSGH
ncbi:MAG: RHS repeat-associated core domain-containing protein, partial [Planctomycetota bacterium]